MLLVLMGIYHTGYKQGLASSISRFLKNLLFQSSKLNPTFSIDEKSKQKI